ncbi:HAD-IC family P-type ATPase [Nesterenkonia alba]|uniref:HAD-IC family P-type ATPase n=1 Tax=Nesterenkonia alba TaxID=515814 RepID=UPI0003B648E7|nr:HAD-IC family P-type ATPase [Nesterenkonia alba]
MTEQRAEDPADRRSAVDPHVLEARGLSAVQVAERQRLGLANVQPHTTSRSIAEILRTHLMTLFNAIIFSCALIIIILGRWLDLLFAIAAVGNVIIGLVQEYGAKRKLDAIALLHQDQIRVLRDGMLWEIHREQIVLDDVVELSRGDQVPADGVVVASADLDVDESMLTGEATPVQKRRGDQLLSGTAVLAGSGRFVVTAVGEHAHAVKLAAEAKKYLKINSEIRRALERIAFWLSIALLPITAVVFNGQMQAHGGWSTAWSTGAWRDALVTAVSSVTAMIPQGLALMTTIAFAVAAVKLARRQVLIQEQPAVEILARVDVVCFDKTGTLTDGTIVFHSASVLDPDGLPTAWERGPAPGVESSSTQVGTPEAWQQVLAHFGADEQANPTAAALRHPFTTLPRHRPAWQVQFSSMRRFSAVTFGEDAGELAGHWILGAPDVLRDGTADRRVDVARLLGHAEAIAAQGLRTMILARAPLEGPIRPEDTEAMRRGEQLPQRLRPVALLTFKENVRHDAATTLEYFRDQDVALKVISGDSPRTVAAVAREVGMEVADDGVDASLLPSDPEGLRSAMATHTVFGRVSPEQKAAMVQALQANGHVVAMTGDGINDALAVKRADLGIAMGSGAPATKAVSRMVLLDGKFSRLPRVLDEGRKVIANTERLAQLFLTKTAYAVILGLFFAVAFWQFPFLPRQFSTADFIMLGLPAFFLALMPNAQRYRRGFLKRSALFSVAPAVAIVAALIAVSAFGRHFGDTAAQIQTASFITLSLVGLWVLNVSLRPLDAARISLVAGLYVLLVAVLLIPISQAYHLFLLPSAELLATAFAASVLGCGLVELGHRGYLAVVGPAEEDTTTTPARPAQPPHGTQPSHLAQPPHAAPAAEPTHPDQPHHGDPSTSDHAEAHQHGTAPHDPGQQAPGAQAPSAHGTGSPDTGSHSTYPMGSIPPTKPLPGRNSGRNQG